MRAEILIKLAFILITFDAFPFHKLGISLSSMPLSYIFIGLFFIANLDNMIKLKIKKFELSIIMYALFMIIFTIITNYRNSFSSLGLNKFINEFILTFIGYFSIKLYLQVKKDYKKILKLAINGIKISVFFGIIQFFYIHVMKLNFIFNILDKITLDTEYLLWGRISMNFGEPSFIGRYILLIIIPYLLLIEKKKKSDNIYICAFIILGILSGSTRIVFDIAAGIVVLTFIYYKEIIKKISLTKIFIGSYIIILSILIMFVIKPDQVFGQIENVQERIAIIFDKDSGKKDLSTECRLSYSLIGPYSLKEKPFGYGIGNYIYAYRDNIKSVNKNYMGNYELVSVYNREWLSSFNMYSRFMVETGILGCLFMLISIIGLFNKVKYNREFTVILLLNLYNIIQSDFMAFIPMLIWISIFLCFNNKEKVNGESVIL
ncbi:O-antigen ligase family protein [Clostridium chauvoei]|uniref:O-antigen polymerase n=2 Tax=Clostridium chauvoei TaxID=46867 RepID=S6F771_9CLOT|nr:O-antigen ligase family protein [Clostridium chauvoei]ATD54259.1 hypothetical protein BTM20_03015 [Clostridium chauvoei]ATD58061.1 hypothetical protein BTM21_10070 [Clostridium chauvoei]MBX7279866.1 O-antigen ligase family protein [Clostridium chauvoei]MBX7282216.1 O-antigen ligase family protein [Clostridium chauvoei]MBX7284756.1 O-antigen ligase family protein [Clostridium chauvoei]